MRDRVEIFRQIAGDNVGAAPANSLLHSLDRVRRAAVPAIATGAVVEVHLEDRLELDLGGGLNDPILDRREADRAFAVPRPSG
jgi:hypothetical protein